MRALLAILLLVAVLGALVAASPRSVTPPDQTSDIVVRFHERLRRGDIGGLIDLADPQCERSVEYEAMLLVAIFNDPTAPITLDRWTEVGRYKAGGGPKLVFLVWSVVGDGAEPRWVELPVVLGLNEQGQAVAVDWRHQAVPARAGKIRQ